MIDCACMAWPHMFQCKWIRMFWGVCTLRCLLIASTKFSVLEGWLVLILAILQVGCLSEIHVYIRIHTC